MSALYFKNYYYPKARCGEDFKEERNFAHKDGLAFLGKDLLCAADYPTGSAIVLSMPSPKIRQLKKWIKLSFGDSRPVKLVTEPGNIYKRICKKSVSNYSTETVYHQHKAANSSKVSIQLMTDKLQSLFETIEPSRNNLRTYGHKI